MTEDKWYEGTKEKYSPPMTERERLQEIEEFFYMREMGSPANKYIEWLIARVKELEEAMAHISENYGCTEDEAHLRFRIKELEEWGIKAVRQLNEKDNRIAELEDGLRTACDWLEYHNVDTEKWQKLLEE
jgi:hypothetical protein